MAHNLLSSVTTPYPEGFKGLGPLGDPGTGVVFNIRSATTKFELALSVTIGVMTIIAVIWFIFLILGAAIQWISAGSDKQAVQNAQKKIGNAIAGLLITTASVMIIVTIGKILGLEYILNPSYFIDRILHP